MLTQMRCCVKKCFEYYSRYRVHQSLSMEAKNLTARRRCEYNMIKPHCALGHITAAPEAWQPRLPEQGASEGAEFLLALA